MKAKEKKEKGVLTFRVGGGAADDAFVAGLGLLLATPSKRGKSAVAATGQNQKRGLVRIFAYNSGLYY